LSVKGISGGVKGSFFEGRREGGREERRRKGEGEREERMQGIKEKGVFSMNRNPLQNLFKPLQKSCKDREKQGEHRERLTSP
jgi:hypothetical protein